MAGQRAGWLKNTYSNGQCQCVETSFVEARGRMRNFGNPGRVAIEFARGVSEVYLLCDFNGEFDLAFTGRDTGAGITGPADRDPGRRISR
jgi:hypothetical protein